MIRLMDESTQARRNGQPARQTKSGRSRCFPIHAHLQQVLEKIEHCSDGFIFHGPLGGRLKADTVRNNLIDHVITPLTVRFPTPEGEKGFADGRLHSFRHYFCSHCANNGVPENVVMKWLGHTDSKMVKHYYHLYDDEAQRQMQRLNFVGDVGGDVAAGNVRSSLEEAGEGI
jgi:integrase